MSLGLLGMHMVTPMNARIYLNTTGLSTYNNKINDESISLLLYIPFVVGCCQCLYI